MSVLLTFDKFLIKVSQEIPRCDMIELKRPNSIMKTFPLNYLYRKYEDGFEDESIDTLIDLFKSVRQMPLNEFVQVNCTYSKLVCVDFIEKPHIVRCAELCALAFSIEGVKKFVPKPIKIAGTGDVSVLQNKVLTILQKGDYYRTFSNYWERAEMFFLVIQAYTTPTGVMTMYSILMRMFERVNDNGAKLEYIYERMGEKTYPCYPKGFFSICDENTPFGSLKSALSHYSNMFHTTKSNDGKYGIFGNTYISRVDYVSIMNVLSIVLIAGDMPIFVKNYKDNMSVMALLMKSINRDFFVIIDPKDAQVNYGQNLIYVHKGGHKHCKVVEEYEEVNINGEITQTLINVDDVFSNYVIFDFEIISIQSEFKDLKKRVTETFSKLKVVSNTYRRVSTPLIVQGKNYRLDYSDYTKAWLVPEGSAGLSGSEVLLEMCKHMCFKAYWGSYYNFDLSDHEDCVKELLEHLSYNKTVAKKDVEHSIKIDAFKKDVQAVIGEDKREVIEAKFIKLKGPQKKVVKEADEKIEEIESKDSNEEISDDEEPVDVPRQGDAKSEVKDVHSIGIKSSVSHAVDVNPKPIDKQISNATYQNNNNTEPTKDNNVSSRTTGTNQNNNNSRSQQQNNKVQDNKPAISNKSNRRQEVLDDDDEIETKEFKDKEAPLPKGVKKDTFKGKNQ